MPFEKGNKLGKGRPKGGQNKENERFKDALSHLFEENADNLMGWLSQVDNPKERFDILAKFADYLFPKLARTELSGIDDNPIQVEDVNRSLSHEEILAEMERRGLPTNLLDDEIK